MRLAAGGVLIRRLREIRLTPASLAVLASVSILATAFILSSGGARTSAQIAALAALHRPHVQPVTGPSPTLASRRSRPSTPAAPVVTSSPDPGSSSDTTVSDTTTPQSSPTQPSTPSSGGSDNGNGNAGSDGGSKSKPEHAKVAHVFEIALSTTSYDAAFGPQSTATYLRSLEARGTVLSGFQSLGRGELADNLALVSGQGPNPDTSGGCTTYAEFRSGATAKADGLVPGSGCVYPETALTIGDQVSSSGHVWKAYIADMGKQTCVHPNSNATDDSALPGTEPGYDQAHNPFIYFHSLLDLGDCASDDVDLSRLSSDLARKSNAPTFSYIAPGACADADATVSPASGTPGTTTTTTSTTAATTTTTTTTTTTSSSTPAATTCPASEPVAISAEDAFLRLWVPRILASPAYKSRGMLVIAFTGAGAAQGNGPVRTGALVLSHGGPTHKTVKTSYGPYSLLRSVEDALAYQPLGHAKGAPSFASRVLG